MPRFIKAKENQNALLEKKVISNIGVIPAKRMLPSCIGLQVLNT